MKFAYLIMAHNNPVQLDILLGLLDYSNNDIYLHIDRKNKDIDLQHLVEKVKFATLHIYKKYKVYHADISQTKCQIYLLNQACRKYHDYYHLISNADLPLKTNREIERFFEDNKGKQFVHFESDGYCPKEACRFFHFLSSWVKKSRGGFVKNILMATEKKSLNLQKKVGINRKFYCGANWYSITHELAVDFCKYRRQILRKVRWTESSDELVLQTFLRSMTHNEYVFYARTRSPEDYASLRRSIDWIRGNPYVWRNVDYEELIHSESLYARKFDINVDKEVIWSLAEYLIKGEKHEEYDRQKYF